MCGNGKSGILLRICCHLNTLVMAYDDQFAQRIRQTLAERNIDTEEKKMFGGLCFMVNGKMAVGITNKEDLMVRCLPEKQDWALEQNGCREMDFTGKPLKAFLFVDESGYPDERSFRMWIDLGIEFALSLKTVKKKK